MPETMPTHKDLDPAVDARTISRRRLLKALVASGLAVAGSSLPAEWFSPEVEVGVLPAHAQVSPVPPPYSMLRCFAEVVQIEGWTLRGDCTISPASDGIEMVQTITRLSDGQDLRVETGFTDISGVFEPPELYPFDLNDLPVRVSWAFSDDTVGTGTCDSTLDPIPQ